MNKLDFINSIKASKGELSCDLVLRNASILDVFSKTLFKGDIGIYKGLFVSLSPNLKGKEEIDCTGKYIVPGLIDPHIHLESSLVSPVEYTKEVLKHGVTTVVADPHEIGNVLGTSGIEDLLSLTHDIPFDFNFMLPSCVPATSFENSGAVISAKDISPLYSKNNVLGLGEVMNFPSLLNCEDDMIDKLFNAYSNNKPIDGHCAGFSPSLLDTYRTANVTTDHEAINKEEALERIRRGIYVLIREGTVAKNLKDILPAVTPYNSSFFSFCTDDKHLDDIVNEGTIDHCIRLATSQGMDINLAISLATINPALCYNFKNKGAISPGYVADFLILDSLINFKISSVYKNGVNVVSNNKVNESLFQTPSLKRDVNSINYKNIEKKDLEISLKGKSKLNVIELIPNKLETIKREITINNSYGEVFSHNLKEDLVKVAVIERHKALGNVGLAIVKGLKLENGALATTIAHDSHNIIVAGTNDSDMLLAVEELKNIGGGIIITNNGQVLASLKLEIGGLITMRRSIDVLKELEHLHHTLKITSPTLDFNPFLTLSFLALPVIPDIKITDLGLFDVKSFEFIKVAE